jgi:SNF2 family DNA or RNA helicase
VSLRGYQAFGAKFALQQRKAIVGDEMGLGKTVEALAAMCHLQAHEGATHFLVVCPLSVLVNWIHEVGRHTRLRAHRLHGPEQRRAMLSWWRHGGIGVTTYEALKSVQAPEAGQVAMLVVDEAHYVKNAKTERTKRVAHWAARTERALFLSGTPMENNVGEFRTLVAHLQPGVAARVRAVDGLAGAGRFRREVASVYVRRNQDDVLEELPPKIEHADWVEMTDADLDAYRAAVGERNFMAMRQAAFEPADPAGSAKLARLLEIVEEAAENDRKVIVFSYFRSVLRRVHEALGERSVGVINGSVPGPERQAMVDEFTARSGPAVLVSQFEAGGQGLNIQAASVVILCEPQWKPTIEEQAIARCHRMGQVRPVDVYRLFAADSVDQRMLEILDAKADLFDEYVRPSDLKDHSPDAVDVSDVETAKETATRAELKRVITEAEYRRLYGEAA